MKVRVYQIDLERDINRLAFMDYEFAHEHGLKPELYDLVFDGELEANVLDDIYMILNIGLRPKGYHGRSLSVSDIVEIVKDKESAFFYCDAFGWNSIEFDASKVNNPSFDYGELEEEHDPCEGCPRFDGGYNCKHCRYGDDGDYSIYDVYRMDELI